MTRRILTGAAAAAVLVLIAATSALAGGWATVTPDEAAPPSEGETVTLGFTVLQHGETPASWVAATVVLEPIGGGEAIRTPARSDNAKGHFVASVTFPASGYWTWRVELQDLINDSPPSLMAVLTADGTAPTFDTATMLALIDQSGDRVRGELADDYAGRIERVEAQLEGVVSQLNTTVAERNALTERVAGLESGPGVPVAGLLALAVLGGAAAGFAMTVLARRSESPTPANAQRPATEPVAGH
jgi:hypothetical protein